MAGQASRENGKKGGRPVAGHTIQAETYRKALIAAVLKEKEPIIEALISQAKQGNVPAQKEINERVLGKVTQPVELTEHKILIEDDNGDLQVRRD